MVNTPMIANPVWRGRNFLINKELCFVVMPFSEDWSQTIFNYIKKITSMFDLQASRADSVSGHIIIEDIWRLINEARIVIVDVSSNNPNVFYELGIAHTLGKDIILLAQTVDNIPFDISSYRHIIYTYSPETYEILEKQLSNHIKEIIKNSPTGNPVLDDTIQKLEYWKTQEYDYDCLIKTGKLQLIQKFVNVDELSDEILTYCLMSAIYYGAVDEMAYWIVLNKENVFAAKVLGTYVTMIYKRPRFRSAYLIQFLKKDARNVALEVIVKDCKYKHLIKHIKKGAMAKYVKNNIEKDPDLITTYAKKILGEYKAMSKHLE